MKIVSLDLHAEASQMYVCEENGQTLMEMRVPTEPEQLRQAVSAICGTKWVAFEQGPLSPMVSQALAGVADRIISCDPTYNAMIALDEASNDERDARHLAQLVLLGAVHEVFVPHEPYLSLRSLVTHRLSTVHLRTGVKNRIKGLARRYAVPTDGKRLYRPGTRRFALERIDSRQIQWQMMSLWRILDAMDGEVNGVEKEIKAMTERFAVNEKLLTVPGVGPVTTATLIAWIVDPWRFDNRNCINSYCGLGLGQNVTSWQQIGPARASLRGNRQLKRVLLLAANAACRTNTALGRRYRIRIEQGWDHRRIMRDLARKILHICWSIMKKGTVYDDNKVNGLQTV